LLPEGSYLSDEYKYASAQKPTVSFDLSLLVGSCVLTRRIPCQRKYLSAAVSRSNLYLDEVDQPTTAALLHDIHRSL
jgi:hypothetical protein